jgi:hypothetical protein
VFVSLQRLIVTFKPEGAKIREEGMPMDIAQGEKVEKELDAMIECRSREGDVDPEEREELWKASVARHKARRDEEMRVAWCEHHQGQAARLRAVLEALISRHEEQVERYRDQLTEG